MMKKAHALFVVSFLLGMTSTVSGQFLPEPANVIPLYEGVAPGSESWDWEENTAESAAGLPMVQNVVKPVLMYYPPDSGTDVGTAMVIAPGGGFRTLMMSYEGVDIARYLNKLGVHAYVLKYRLTHQGDSTKQDGQDIRKLAGADGQQAVRLVRRGATEMGIEPDRIGMIGFSAGGGVTLSSVFGPADGRPDFAVPVYTAGGSKPGSPIVVPENAPPLCIFTAANDQLIPWERSMELFVAWKEAGFLAEIHIFQTGRHGFVEKGGGADYFMDRLQEWMKVNGWLNKGP
jgi:acetyl esterase/lipase